MSGRQPRACAGLRSLRRCRGLLHFGPSHRILRPSLRSELVSGGPRPAILCPRVDKPAPTLAAPPFFHHPSASAMPSRCRMCPVPTSVMTQKFGAYAVYLYLRCRN